MMGLAAKMISCSNHPKYRYSCLITKSNKVLSVGVNKVSSPKRFTPQRPGLHLHAEVDAIYNMDKEKTRGTTAYINGLSAANNLINSKPCDICLFTLLDKMGVRRIVYSNRGIYEEIK